MKLLEIVAPAWWTRRGGGHRHDAGQAPPKTCVVSGVCDGFIGNRILDPYCAADLPDRRRLQPGRDRRRRGEVRLPDGAVPDERPGR